MDQLTQLIDDKGRNWNQEVFLHNYDIIHNVTHYCVYIFFSPRLKF